MSASGEAGLKVALAKDKAAANAVDPASKYGETALMLAAEKGMVENKVDQPIFLVNTNTQAAGAPPSLFRRPRWTTGRCDAI